MSPSPISHNAVNVVLHYIAPPSQISQPLPPFLLSKALLQRHHFLAISYDDPALYLTWPSDSSSKAVDLLELLPTPIEDFAPPSYPTHYSADGEDIYAHVAISPPDREGLRLVFQWDDPDGWKFHDLKTMPFPQGSCPSLLQALAAADPSAAMPHPDHSPHALDGGSGDDGDDDDYWNAYGAADSAGASPMLHSHPLKDDAGDSEDAYWARYASVHGTADSTIPSPRDPKRRPPGVHHDSPHPLSAPPTDLLGFPHYDHPNHISVLPMNKHAPASPTTLARLLSDASPRRSPAPCFEHEINASDFSSDETDVMKDFPTYRSEYAVQDPGPEYAPFGLGLLSVGVGLGADENLELSSPLDGSDDSDETPSPPEEVDTDAREGNGVGALGLTRDLADSLNYHGANESSPSQTSTAQPSGIRTEKSFVSSGSDPLAEAALRGSVKGLYTLWQATARTSGCEAQEKEAFMRIVADAIGHSV